MVDIWAIVVSSSAGGIIIGGVVGGLSYLAHRSDILQYDEMVEDLKKNLLDEYYDENKIQGARIQEMDAALKWYRKKLAANGIKGIRRPKEKDDSGQPK
jgi:hypothetical protein